MIVWIQETDLHIFTNTKPDYYFPFSLHYWALVHANSWWVEELFVSWIAELQLVQDGKKQGRICAIEYWCQGRSAAQIAGETLFWEVPHMDVNALALPK